MHNGALTPLLLGKEPGAADVLAQAKTGGLGFVLLIVQPGEINVL